MRVAMASVCLEEQVLLPLACPLISVYTHTHTLQCEGPMLQEHSVSLSITPDLAHFGGVATDDCNIFHRHAILPSLLGSATN